MGTFPTFPVKENSPARLEATISGNSRSSTVNWYRVPGGTYKGATQTKTAFGSGNPYTFTTSSDDYGLWVFEVEVIASNGKVATSNCSYYVLPNPSNRLDPDGTPPTVNPVLWVPRGAFPGDVVPQSMIDQLKRSMRRLQAGFFEMYGKTFRMNDLKVVVSPLSENDICGGDCTDLGKVEILVNGHAVWDAFSAVGGCELGEYACIPFTRQVLVLAWGGGGYAGATGPDFALARVGDWSITPAGNVLLPPIEPNVGWQLTGLGLASPQVDGTAHELNHSIGWDDRNDWVLGQPANPIEIAISRSLPWLTESMADTQNPAVSIASPANNATISGTVNVAVNVSDSGGSGVDAVMLLVDGYWYATATMPPYTISLDTTKFGHGLRKLTAVAYDNAGHIEKSEITVTVNNVVPGGCSTSYPLNTGTVCYYDGIGFTGTYLGSLQDPPILLTENGNFGWWPKHPPNSGIVAFGKSDNVSGVWRSQLYFPPATYRFLVRSDDGVRFYVNDVLILDKWISQYYNESEVDVNLSGFTNLKFEWYDQSAGQLLEALWRPVTSGPAPDLTVDSVGSSPTPPSAGSLMSFSGTVKNTGGVAEPSSARLRIDIGADGSWDVLPSDLSVGSLATNQTQSVTWSNIWTAALGTHRFEICVDPASTVPESDETNNCTSQLFTVAYPDLVVESPGYLPSSPRSGDAMSFSAAVKNQGPATAGGSSTRLRIDVDDNGTWDVLPSNVSVGSLAPNATQTAAWSGVWTAAIGTHRFEICADAGSAVSESDENNNCIARTFTVGSSAPGPDLIIQSPSTAPSPPRTGNSVTFTAIVRNQGLANAASSSARLRIDIGNDGTWDVFPPNESVKPIKSGSDRTASWPNAWTATTGTHRFEVCADITNAVAESIESNNCTVQIFFVPVFYDDFSGAAIDTTLWSTSLGGGGTIGQSGGLLTMTVPSQANAWADLVSKSAFPVGSTFETRVFVSRGQFLDHKGVGFANARVGADCSVGESEAAMWRGQDGSSISETKSGGLAACETIQFDYPEGWRRIKVIRASDTEVRIYENDVLIGTHTTYVPTIGLPIRFSAFTYTGGGPSQPITIQIDWVQTY